MWQLWKLWLLAWYEVSSNSCLKSFRHLQITRLKPAQVADVGGGEGLDGVEGLQGLLGGDGVQGGFVLTEGTFLVLVVKQPD